MRAVALGLILVAGLSALAAQAAGSARVTGLVRLCGGPAPSRCFTQKASVTVLGAAGRVVATETTVHGRFSFSLPPGSYTLVATTGGATGRRTVVLSAGHTRRANIVVAIR